MKSKVSKFTDLNVWREGHELVLMVYNATDQFPKKETYSLTDQMRRASVSVTSNIAEGFTRIGVKDKIRFYVIAAGSITELQNQLIIAKDIGYLKKDTYVGIYRKSIVTHKMLNALIKSLKS